MGGEGKAKKGRKGKGKVGGRKGEKVASWLWRDGRPSLVNADYLVSR